MEVIIQPDTLAASCVAARVVAQVIRKKPDTVLALATGKTPVTLYRELVRMHIDEDLSFHNVTVFALDEYIGVGPDHPCSSATYLADNLYNHVDIQPERIFNFDGLAADVPGQCAAYEKAIADAGGIDLQILGVGADGHLGYNDPSSSLGSRTRIKTLTDLARKDVMTYFRNPADAPKHCLTMGVGSIIESRGIILLAFGEIKSRAVARMVEGPITAMVPASVLQFHTNTKVFIDEAAASELERRNYYKYVYENKPGWQQY